MSTLFSRLREWRAIAATAPVSQDPQAAGGWEAERFLQDLVESHANFKGAGLYPNKRVPAGRRRREIDLIVVTAKRIHVIEVKNWSGSLRVGPGGWIQTNRDGREIQHPDLVADHQAKDLALIEYLQGEGISLDAGSMGKYMTNKVVFMNRRLTVEDRAIADNPGVLLPDRLEAYLGGQRRSGLGERVLGSVVQWCFDTESADAVMDDRFGSLTSDKVRAIRDAVDRLATWDTLRFHGSRTETGDLLSVSIGDEVVPRDRIGGRGEVAVRWTRNRAWGLLKAITGFGSLGRLRSSTGTRPISVHDFVLFHRAGEPSPSRIPLVSLDGVSLG